MLAAQSIRFQQGPRMPPEFSTHDHVRAVIADAVVERRCGLHPWERHPERPNRLKINVEMFARLPAGPMGESAFIDYDRVRDFLKTFPSLPHTDLLEIIVDEIVAKCFENDRVEACRVSVFKPDIFGEAEAAGVEVFRTRASWQG
jgi:7,8-dihydroneopterin aldolase/epimerase/oxygenase